MMKSRSEVKRILTVKPEKVITEYFQMKEALKEAHACLQAMANEFGELTYDGKEAKAWVDKWKELLKNEDQ